MQFPSVKGLMGMLANVFQNGNGIHFFLVNLPLLASHQRCFIIFIIYIYIFTCIKSSPFELFIFVLE